MWSHGTPGLWGWLAMSVSIVIFWGLVAWGILTLVRDRGASSTPRPTPEEPLAERLARGEIGEAEYGERLAALRRADARPPTRVA